MTELAIRDLMDDLLLPQGFERNPNGLPVYTRNINGVLQEIGLRSGKTSDKRYAVYFKVPGEDQFYELSPICALKNTYWWPDKLSEQLAESLKNQISDLALSYFNRPVEEKYKLKAKKQINEALECLSKGSTPFALFEDGFWRTRGDFIDIVDVEILVDYSFAYIYVTCWHKSLMEDYEDFIPEDTTRVASQTIGNNKVDIEPNSTIFFLGTPEINKNPIDKSICSSIKQYFDQIITVKQVMGNIRPEYKHHYA